MWSNAVGGRHVSGASVSQFLHPARCRPVQTRGHTWPAIPGGCPSGAGPPASPNGGCLPVTLLARPTLCAGLAIDPPIELHALLPWLEHDAIALQAHPCRPQTCVAPATHPKPPSALPQSSNEAAHCDAAGGSRRRRLPTPPGSRGIRGRGRRRQDIGILGGRRREVGA